MPKTAKKIESMNAGILVNEIFTMEAEIGNTNTENTDTDIGKSMDGISHMEDMEDMDIKDMEDMDIKDIKDMEDMEDVEVEDVEEVDVMTVINVLDLAEKHV